MDRLNIIDCITLLVSLVGACAWLPWVWEIVRRPKIVCKVLEYNWIKDGVFSSNLPFEDGLKKEYYGNTYLLCLRVISRNNDFPLETFKAKIKFCSMTEEMDAIVHCAPQFNVTDTNKVYKRDVSKNILYCPLLIKNRVYDLETHIIVESKKQDVEYFKFIFINTRGKRRTVKVTQKDLTCALDAFR